MCPAPPRWTSKNVLRVGKTSRYPTVFCDISVITLLLVRDTASENQVCRAFPYTQSILTPCTPERSEGERLYYFGCGLDALVIHDGRLFLQKYCPLPEDTCDLSSRLIDRLQLPPFCVKTLHRTRFEP